MTMRGPLNLMLGLGLPIQRCKVVRREAEFELEFGPVRVPRSTPPLLPPFTFTDSESAAAVDAPPSLLEYLAVRKEPDQMAQLRQDLYRIFSMIPPTTLERCVWLAHRIHVSMSAETVEKTARELFFMTVPHLIRFDNTHYWYFKNGRFEQFETHVAMRGTVCKDIASPILNKQGKAVFMLLIEKEAALRVASTYTDLKLPPPDQFACALDRSPNIVCCPNGIVDLGQRLFVPHHPKYLVSRCTAADFPHGYGPIKMVDDTLNPFKLVVSNLEDDFVTWVALALSRTPALHKFFLHYTGPADSFKSTVLCILKDSVLGSYVVPVPDECVRAVSKKQSLDCIATAAIGYVSEAGILDQDLIKQISGGDPVGPKSLRIMSTLFFISNPQLRFKAPDNATWRRMKTYEVGPPASPFPDLATIDAPGLLAYVVQRIFAIRDARVAIPAGARRSASALASWLREHAERADGAWLGLRAVLRACPDGTSREELVQALQDEGYTVHLEKRKDDVRNPVDIRFTSPAMQSVALVGGSTELGSYERAVGRFFDDISTAIDAPPLAKFLVRVFQTRNERVSEKNCPFGMIGVEVCLDAFREKIENVDPELRADAELRMHAIMWALNGLFHGQPTRLGSISGKRYADIVHEFIKSAKNAHDTPRRVILILDLAQEARTASDPSHSPFAMVSVEATDLEAFREAAGRNEKATRAMSSIAYMLNTLFHNHDAKRPRLTQ